MAVEEWTCSQCTFLHKYSAERCMMCSALRVSKQQMRDFVAGHGINNGNSSGISSSSNNNAVGQVQQNSNNADSERNGGGYQGFNNGGVNDGNSRSSSVGITTNNQQQSMQMGNTGRTSTMLHPPRPKSSNGPTISNNPYAAKQTPAANPYNNVRPAPRHHSMDIEHPNLHQQKNSNSRGNSAPMQNNNATNITSQVQHQNYNVLPIPRTPRQNTADAVAQQHQQSSIIKNPYARGSSSSPQKKTVNPYANNRSSPHHKVSMQTAATNQHNQSHNQPQQQQQKQSNAQGSNQSYQPNHSAVSSMGQQQQKPQPQHNTNNNRQNNLHGFFSGSGPQQPQQRQQTTSNVAATAHSSALRQSNPSTIGYRHGTFLKEKPYEPGPIPICTQTNHNWIYPLDEKYPERTYQLQMSHAAIMQNTLVSLPTGLGKTLIAAVVMYNYYRWFPSGKVVFCAPTRPLVSQQIHACYKIMGIPENHTAEISGRSKPDTRILMWKNKRVFFCTPQTLVKDIQEARCNPQSIVCVVMDEAHRATGEHANTVLARLIRDSGAKFRFVGLSATPGTDIKSIQAVLDTLHISRIEARTEDDPNVKQYIHKREEEVIVVKQPDAVKLLDRQFSELICPLLERLRAERVSQRLSYDTANLTQWSVMLARKEYVERTNDHRLDMQFNILGELVRHRATLKEHGVQLARQNLAAASQKNFMRGTANKQEFQALMRDMMIAASGASQEMDDTSNSFENNPKLSKLVEVLTEHFERKQAIGESTRVIVFSQWRESVGGIVKMISHQNLSSLKPAQFIGQASKKAANKTKIGSSSYSTGQDAAGMNQQQQQRVLQQFSEGVYNILVCTCVGEEGLDIGEVDLIVNFDVMKSPIRSIQRNGRTGRKRDGRVVFLIADHEEKKYRESVVNSNKISRALKDPSVFKMCQNAPMFDNEPDLMRKKMNVTNFRLSQVGGHTPKMKRRNKEKGARAGQKGEGSRKQRNQSRVIETNWRLDQLQEEERKRLFGRLPRSSCRDYESKSSEFPPSLKRRYLNSRSQSSIYSKILQGNCKATFVSAGRSSSIVKQLEQTYITVKERIPSPKKISDDKNEEQDVVEVIDSDNDCASVDFGSDNNSISPNSGTRCTSKRSENSSMLDGIFGPIRRDEISVNATDIANLFDVEHHKCCAVVAPPGMELDDSSDEDDSKSFISATSAVSEMSITINDDMCAFFDKNNSSDLAAQEQSQTSPVVEIKTPCSDGGSDDEEFGGADNQLDFDADYVESLNQVDDAGKCLESALVIGEGSQGTLLSPIKQPARIDRARGLAGEKENINSQLSLSPTREDNHISNTLSERRQLSQPQEGFAKNEEDETTNEKPPELAKEDKEDENAELLALLEAAEPPSAKNNGNVNKSPAPNEDQSPIVTSFRLPTPPPSSSDDDSDDDDDDSDERGPSKDEPMIEESMIDEPAAETSLDNSTSFFQLPTQDSSSSSEEEDVDDDEEEDSSDAGKDDKCNKQPPPISHDTTLNISFQETSGEANSFLNNTATRQQPNNRGEGFANNNKERQVHFSMPAAEDLSDTTIKAASFAVDPAKPRMSLDSLTDTPIKPRHNVSKPRKSFDSLADTPIQRDDDIIGQHKRKRLRVAASTNDSDKKNAGSPAKKDTLKRRIEGKYRNPFLDCEAANDDSDESDEEDELRRLEDEEGSHDSFINDTSQLGYSQDELDCCDADAEVELCDGGDAHLQRQLNQQNEIDLQWKTPVFNRKMREPSSQLSQHEHGTQSSSKGIGRMNFIRSVIEHHRSGGDADEIEEEYHRLAVNPHHSPTQSTQPADSHVPMRSSSAAEPTYTTHMGNSMQQAGFARQQNQDSNVARGGMPTETSSSVAPSSDKPMKLTAEQRAMIDAKRVEALKRRQQKMQQQQQQASAPFNPYAKR